MNYALRFVIFTSLFVLALINQPNFCLAGFGVSPPGIIEDKLIRGSHLERTIYLVQGDPKENLDIEVTVDSTEIENWFSFEPGKNFTISAGVQQFPLKIIINVPQDAELNIYKAFVRVSTKPKLAEGAGQVSIAVGGRIDVDLTVGEGLVSDFKVRRIQILDIKEGDSPKISLTIENIGNVPAGPERVSFELFNKYGNIRLAYAEVSEFKKIEAFKTESITVEFPIDIRLGVGEYWGAVKVYKDSNVSQELKTVFNVHPKTFLEKYGWLIAVALLVIVTIGFWFIRFLIKKRKSKI